MSTWQRRKNTRRRLRFCSVCMGSGKTVTHVNIMTDREIMGDCRYCKGTGRKLDSSTQRRANDAGHYHDSECECATCQLNDHLGYDADVADPGQYCRHGAFIGSAWGPDYLCGKCEMGVGVCADCRCDLYPDHEWDESERVSGYDYVSRAGEGGRYSPFWHETLCQSCEQRRNQFVQDRFRAFEIAAHLERSGLVASADVFRETAREDPTKAVQSAIAVGLA